MLTDDVHGLPKWAWIAGALVVLVALLLARRNASASAPAAAQPVDASAAVAADAATQQANAAAKASVFSDLIAGVFGLEATRSTNNAALQSNLAAAETAREVARTNAGAASPSAPSAPPLQLSAHTAAEDKAAGVPHTFSTRRPAISGRPYSTGKHWDDYVVGAGQAVGGTVLKLGLHI